MYFLSKPYVQCMLVLLVVAFVFWPGLEGDFLFDDYPNIVSNQAVHALHIDYETLAAAAKAYNFDGGLNRPLVTMWFSLDYYLGGGRPWIFKLSGLLVHLLNVLLVIVLLRKLLQLAAERSGMECAGAWTAIPLALIWAIHPLQVSSVLYIVQRMETFSLSFVLLGLIAYLNGRHRQQSGKAGWPYLLACVPLALLALACKESALLFPAYTFSLELTVLGFAAQSTVTTKRWRRSYAVAIGAALLVFVFWALPRYASDAAYAVRDFTVGERLLTQFRVLSTYLGQMVLPSPQRLTFYYDDFALSRTLFDPMSTLGSAALLLAMIVSAVTWRKRVPLYSLGVLWFFSAHLLTSNVVALELVFEHRNYFALLGILLAIYAVGSRLPLPASALLLRTLTMLLFLGLGALTLLRSATWGDPFLLAADMVAKNPNSARAGSDLGALYFGASHGDVASPYFQKGINEFERAGKLPNASPVPDQGLIVMLSTVGVAAGSDVWARLIEKLQIRPIGSQEVMALAGLLNVRESGRGLDDERLAEACRIVLSRSNSPAELYLRCGSHALFTLRDEARGKSLLMEALERSPEGSRVPAKIVSLLTRHERQDIVEIFRKKMVRNISVDDEKN